MDINEAIAMLETTGFRLYRHIVNESELIGALLLYPDVDLYVEVDSLIDGALLRFNGPAGSYTFNCADTTSLQEAVQGQIRSTTQVWHEKGLPPTYPDLEEHLGESDLDTLQQLKRMKAEYGSAIELIWLTWNSGLRCLYRGAVISINEDLMTAIGVDGERVEIPLKIALDLLDEMGGLEKQQLKQPEALAT